MFFNPNAVAVIGASRNPDSAGQGILKSLVSGGVFRSKTNKPFKGNVYPINPNADKILGKKCYKTLQEIKEPLDLAVICVNAKIVPLAMKECAEKGVKAAVVISAGFGELGEEGKRLQREVIDIAKAARIRIIGPNCLGIQRPSSSLNATFGPCMAPEGKVAFFSQSGALVDSVIDWSLEHDYGFSTIVSYGNSSDLDVADFIDWAEKDEKTKAIAIYIEGLKDGRKFIDVAKRVSKTKPIVVLKAGKTESGSKAISSHTGSLAGSYEIYKAAFRKCGVEVAEDVDELFDLAKVLACLPACKTNSVAIITNGGGAGVLCADHCEGFGIKLTPLTEETVKKLDASGVMHPAYSRRNPLDIVGDATAQRYKTAIDTVLRQDDISGLIVIQTLQTMTSSVLNAEAVINARSEIPNKPIVCSYMGGKFTKKGVELLEAKGVPEFNVPYKTARAVKALVTRGEWLKQN